MLAKYGAAMALSATVVVVDSIKDGMRAIVAMKLGATGAVAGLGSVAEDVKTAALETSRLVSADDPVANIMGEARGTASASPGKSGSVATKDPKELLLTDEDNSKTEGVEPKAVNSPKLSSAGGFSAKGEAAYDDALLKPGVKI